MSHEYYISKNPQENGEHELHNSNCPLLPAKDDLVCLGECKSCYDAYKKAKEYYNHVDGCYYCCYEINKT